MLMLPLIITLDNICYFEKYLNNVATTMTHPSTNYPVELKVVEDKLDQLIEQYYSVKNENDSLKISQEELAKEKIQLLEKTTLARTRVEAMISRLKAMEQGL
ncbi:MAG: TIGR02449 family protein [Methylococcaceae bacterium]